MSRKLLRSMEELQAGVSHSLESLSSALRIIQAKQEQFDDQLAFGQSDMEARENELARRPFVVLNALDAQALVASIGAERPQLLALVLSFVDDALAGAVLDALPEDRQSLLVERMVSLEKADPLLLAALDKTLRVLLSSAELKLVDTGGAHKVAGVLNHVSRATEKRVIQAMEKSQPDVAEEIKRTMFVFEDICLLEDESIRAVFERAELQDIVLALKPLQEDLRERLLACFPKERLAEVRETFQRMGRVRVRDADAAGLRVVEVIKQLEGEGRIFIAREFE